MLRLLRLDWQPLWWDEGYSVYFATERLADMVALTANDIHPPLYYALLHGWAQLVQSIHPATLRIFSALVGVVGVALFLRLAQTLYARRPLVIWPAALLLVVNPMHLYYSHEVRMYGLALALGLLSTVALWRLTTAQAAGTTTVRAAILYGVSAALSLYTLYYLALLLLAHVLWAVWRFRRNPRQLRPLALALGLAFLLYLPWLLYALPKLAAYVADKVPADADEPLGPLRYIVRHLLAWTGSHLTPRTMAGQILWWLGGGVSAALLLTTRIQTRRTTHQEQPHQNQPATLLAICVAAPALVAFALNLRLPFFPAGGERLLLFVLPYFLLLLADAVERNGRRLGRIALLALLLAAAGGGWRFFTLPRYAEHDYRPLIRQIVQQSATTDTVLAIFPWEVGYWRAYAMTTACQSAPAPCTWLRGPEAEGPHMALLDNRSIQWGPAVMARMDEALGRGALWFAAPLGFGSTLPDEIERYLAQTAVNLADQWMTPTTRLTAWGALPIPQPQPLAIDFGRVQLVTAGVEPEEAVAANQPLAVALTWAGDALNELAAGDLGVTVRLVDSAGHTWAARTYAPLGRLSGPAPTQAGRDVMGLRTPVGIPPGDYAVVAGVMVSSTQTLLQPEGSDRGATQVAPVGRVRIRAPETALPPYRLPIQRPLTPPARRDGVALLGSAGNWAGGDALLAGEAVQVTLFWQNEQTPPRERLLFVRLFDPQGVAVAGWEGMSLPGWPDGAWPPLGLAQAPLRFFTPATLPTGRYMLRAGWSGLVGGAERITDVGNVDIHQRLADFAAPLLADPLPMPVQFGAHVRLLSAAQARQGDGLTLLLTWQVMQTLLPPHHIFVHVVAADGEVVAQVDGPPQTAAGPAPSGSWQAGEYLITEHHLTLPPDLRNGQVRVGLYLPEDGVRLPAAIDGSPAGDAAVLSLAP